jgi:hypothetical protein
MIWVNKSVIKWILNKTQRIKIYAHILPNFFCQVTWNKCNLHMTD